MQTVNAKSVSGFNMSISMLFGKSPLLTIVCGNCQYTFQTRTPTIDYAKALCPACNCLNKLPLIYE